MGEDFTEGFPKGVTPRLRHQGVMKPQQRLLQKEQRLGGKRKQNEWGHEILRQRDREGVGNCTKTRLIRVRFPELEFQLLSRKQGATEASVGGEQHGSICTLERSVRLAQLPWDTAGRVYRDHYLRVGKKWRRAATGTENRYSELAIEGNRGPVPVTKCLSPTRKNLSCVRQVWVFTQTLWI